MYEGYDQIEMFSLYLAATIGKADVTDIKDGELRSLRPVNPVHLQDMDKWDGKLQMKTDWHSGDLAINNKREMFHFRMGSWYKIIDGKPELYVPGIGIK